MSSGLGENTPLQSKGILIAVVVVFSSLSFSLGYFVGKIGREERTETASQIPEAPQQVAGESVEALPEKSSRDKGPDLAPESQKSPVQKAAINSTENENPRTAAQITDAGPANKPEETNRQEKTVPRKSGKANSAEKAKEKTVADGRTPQNEGVKYTVQLGALKSAEEAKKLKSQFLRKGYKAYISSSQEPGSRRKIYKVRAGEFDQKKEAEILALKINKSEGLKTFVTPKD